MRRFAYADPPYIGQARKHYAHDPRCAEVMAAWVKPFASFKRGVAVAYTWEPVLFRTVRPWSKETPTIKDHIIEPEPAVVESITMKRGLAGAKPERFCLWLFDLLGMEPEDEFHDLFPGTGAVTDAWEKWRAMQSGGQAQLEIA